MTKQLLKKKNQIMTPDRTLLFFDGTCLFCNFWVQFLLKKDKKRKIYFTSLQSDYAKIYLEPQYLQLESLVLYHQGKIYQKAQAVLKICALLKGWFYVFLMFKIIPNFVLDFFYDLIAKNRYKFFKNTCILNDDERILK